MKKKNIKSIEIIIIFLILIAVVLIALMLLKFAKNEKVSFEENDKLFFKMFVNQFEPEEYEFHSLDAYYLEDTRTYYYNSKFNMYTDFDDRWTEVDKVQYGRYASFQNFYCLNWLSLQGFEDENEEFERAKREGVHKTYTKEEIEEFFKKAYEEKE